MADCVLLSADIILVSHHLLLLRVSAATTDWIEASFIYIDRSVHRGDSLGKE